jgi:hypothetical protein
MEPSLMQIAFYAVTRASKVASIRQKYFSK